MKKGEPLDLLRKLGTKFTVGDGCWEWTACKDEWGYGKMQIDYKTKKAHRVLYELMVGPIPEGLEIDHLCRNRGCVRPDHLEAVTPAENVLRSEVRTWQRSKTHCPQGHPLSGSNLRPNRKHRECRLCANASAARSRKRKKERQRQ